MPHDRGFQAFLFDMDGTILSSIAAAERIWTAWAIRHGLEPRTFLPTIHGVRAVDTIAAQNLPGVDPEREAEAITQAEIEDVEGIEPLPGAAEFIAALPAHRWAVVTSAPRRLALRRIAAAGLPRPEVLIAAEDVAAGKPAPDGFLLAAARLGVSCEECLVFEDSPAGVAAAEAAGAQVVVVAPSHAFRPHHPTIDGYRRLRVDIAERPGAPLTIGFDPAG
jgi:sugar-phosphatase